MVTVMLLSDSAELKSELHSCLVEEDYVVIEAKIQITGQLVFNEINVIILDCTSPQHDIAALIGQVKTYNPLLPMISIVECGNVQAAVQSMRSGALNAVAKPVDKQLLLKSLKEAMSQEIKLHHSQAVIQQAIELLQSIRGQYQIKDDGNAEAESKPESTFINPDGNFEYGDLLINPKQKKAFYAGVSIDLTPSQFSLLAELGEAQGRVVPFEELYFHLHGVQLDRSSARTALSAHMSYLRNKLVTAGCGAYLVNVRGRGYLLEIPEKARSYTHSINLDLVLEQLPIILWTTDHDLLITSIVGNGLAQLHLDASDLIGLNLTDFPQLDNPHHTIHAHHEALLGKSIRFEQRLAGRVFEMYIEPSFNESEQIIGCIGLALDITERKEVEDAYHLLVNHSQQGLTIFQNNRFIFANAATAEITGYTVEELLALDDPIKLFHEEDRPRIYENLRKRLAGEEVPAQSDYRIMRKDGEVRWIEETSFTTNFRGQLAIHTAARDKTQEKQALEARRQIEEVYRILAKSLPQMAVLLFDQNLRYLIAEGQVLEEVGLNRFAMEGKTIWEVLPAEQAESLVPHYLAALNGHETSFEFSADKRVYEVQTLPLKKDDGQIIAGMFIIQDVTRYKIVNA